MSIEPSELLERVSVTLRSEVGPAVADEYNRTQAHMASVILGKVSKQIALADSHATAEQADLEALHNDLSGLLGAAPPEVTAAANRAAEAGSVAALGPLIESLYGWNLDVPEARQALDRVREALRADIDRRMEIAR